MDEMGHVTITLTPDLEQALIVQAHRLGTTPERIVRDCLRERFLPNRTAEGDATEPATLADFLEGYIGVLSSSEHIRDGARMSENSGAQFAAGMVKKRQEGRL
jgi:hypothetical protein